MREPAVDISLTPSSAGHRNGPAAKVCAPGIRGWAALSAIALLSGFPQAAADEPVAIDSTPQYIHDDALVDNYWVPKHSRAIITRRLHQPRRFSGNPVLSQPGLTYLSVDRGNDDIFRIWYQRFNPATLDPDSPKGVPRYGIAYAESDDGLNWRIPDLGLLEWNGDKNNNLVWLGAKGDIAAGGFVTRLPERDRRGYRYAMVYTGSDGLHLVGSNDGVDWDKSSDRMIRHVHSDTFNALVYDPQRQRYLMYCRARDIYRNHQHEHDQGAVRRIAVMTAADPWGEWTENPSTILVPDEIDAERGFTFFYGMPTRYKHGVFWGFLWPFQMNTKIVTELAFSRDGIHFDRLPHRPRLLETGPEGTWDQGMVFMSPFWMEIDDEWWIYYAGIDGPHNQPTTNKSGLGLLKIRRGGFISRYAPKAGGRLCTRPLRWPGGDLVLNVQARSEMRVRAVDVMRQPIEGFTFEDCPSIKGDNVELPVRWGSRSLDELKNKSIRLEFDMRDTDLYTFRATGEPLEDSVRQQMSDRTKQANPTGSNKSSSPWAGE